jgi:acyl carrier protein
MFNNHVDSNKSPLDTFLKVEATSNLLSKKVNNDDGMLLSGRKDDQISEIVSNALKIKKKIKAFIIYKFLFGDENGLENETSFLDSGIIDSTGVLELLSYLEDHFKIQIEDNEVIPENLDSINQVTVFLIRKMGLEI